MKNHDLIIIREFDAPVSSVWRAWTEAALIKKWWGPDRFSCPSADIDFRVGGRALIAMRSPKDFGGGDMFNLWEYKKIVPMQRIEFVSNLCHKDGRKADPQALGMPPDFPIDMLYELEFTELGGQRSKLSITEHGWSPGQMMRLAEMGMEQSLGKLAVKALRPRK